MITHRNDVRDAQDKEFLLKVKSRNKNDIIKFAKAGELQDVSKSKLKAIDKTRKILTSTSEIQSFHGKRITNREMTKERVSQYAKAQGIQSGNRQLFQWNNAMNLISPIDELNTKGDIFGLVINGFKIGTQAISAVLVLTDAISSSKELLDYLDNNRKCKIEFFPSSEVSKIMKENVLDFDDTNDVEHDVDWDEFSRNYESLITMESTTLEVKEMMVNIKEEMYVLRKRLQEAKESNNKAAIIKVCDSGITLLHKYYKEVESIPESVWENTAESLTRNILQFVQVGTSIAQSVISFASHKIFTGSVHVTASFSNLAKLIKDKMESLNFKKYNDHRLKNKNRKGFGNYEKEQALFLISDTIKLLVVTKAEFSKVRN